MSTLIGIDLTSGQDALAVLAFCGPDAAKFLQGQLSADMEKLAPGAGTLAGFHSPQGRVIALLALVRTAPEEYLATLPAELAATVAMRLRKFVLRAKVRIEERPGTKVIGAAMGPPHEGVPEIAWGGRRLLLVPEGRAYRGADTASAGSWRLQDVRDGLPQVQAATSEQFVAQMLNLDLLGAIAFDKGCYTGQEVIARAHYRGRVKRRMQRWLNAGATALKPGDTARGPDGRSLAVVRAGAVGSDGQEVLAVGNYAADDAVPDAAAAEAAGVAVSGPLPLPYALPD
jgi:tRNA-modifying protein YgfZ